MAWLPRVGWTEQLLGVHIVRMDGFHSERSFAAIGRVAVASSDLDDELLLVVTYLIASDRASLITAGQPFSYLEQAIMALGKTHLDEDGWKILLDLLVRARGLHQERDLVIHGIWLPEDIAKLIDSGEEVSSFIAVRRRRWKSDLHGRIIGVEAIEQLAADLAEVSSEVKRFRTKFLPRLDPRT